MKAGWQVKHLAIICKIFSDGDWIESKDQSAKGIRLIQTGNVGEGFFKDRGEKARYISRETFARLRCTEIFENDCLISRLPDPVGRSCLLPDTGEQMITAVDCTIVRFDSSQFISEFFVYYTQSNDYLSNVDAETSGTTRKRISRSKLGEIPIPVPPIQEQQRVVAILDEAFAQITIARTNTEKNLQNARALFESHLQSVFSVRPELRAGRAVEGRGEGWELKTLNLIAENLDSKRVPITKNVRSNGAFPYYGASGIVDYVSEFIFDDDLLLISEDGANLLARTYPIAFSISGRTWVNNHAHVLKFKEVATQRLVEYYLNSIPLNDFVSGMAQPKLNQKMLNAIPIPVPPLAEQQVIVVKLDELHQETQHLESLYQGKLTALDELKKSLLHKAFAGEL